MTKWKSNLSRNRYGSPAFQLKIDSSHQRKEKFRDQMDGVEVSRVVSVQKRRVVKFLVELIYSKVSHSRASVTETYNK